MTDSFEFEKDDAGRPTWIRWSGLDIQFLPGSGSISTEYYLIPDLYITQINIEQASLQIEGFEFWSMSARITQKTITLLGPAYMKRNLLTYTRRQIVISDRGGPYFDVRVDSPRFRDPHGGRWLKGIPQPEGGVEVLRGGSLIESLLRP